MPQLFQRRMLQPNILSLNPFASATPSTDEQSIIPSRANWAEEKARNLQTTATKEEIERGGLGDEPAGDKAPPHSEILNTDVLNEEMSPISSCNHPATIPV